MRSYEVCRSSSALHQVEFAPLCCARVSSKPISAPSLISLRSPSSGPGGFTACDLADFSGAGEWPRSPRLHPLESNLPLHRHCPRQLPSGKPAEWPLGFWQCISPSIPCTALPKRSLFGAGPVLRPIAYEPSARRRLTGSGMAAWGHRVAARSVLEAVGRRRARSITSEAPAIRSRLTGLIDPTVWDLKSAARPPDHRPGGSTGKVGGSLAL